MKNIIGQHHFIFSVENPLHPSKLAVTPTHEQALQYLKDQGEDVMLRAFVVKNLFSCYTKINKF